MAMQAYFLNFHPEHKSAAFFTPTDQQLHSTEHPGQASSTSSPYATAIARLERRATFTEVMNAPRLPLRQIPRGSNLEDGPLLVSAAGLTSTKTAQQPKAASGLDFKLLCDGDINCLGPITSGSAIMTPRHEHAPSTGAIGAQFGAATLVVNKRRDPFKYLEQIGRDLINATCDGLEGPMAHGLTPGYGPAPSAVLTDMRNSTAAQPSRAVDQGVPAMDTKAGRTWQQQAMLVCDDGREYPKRLTLQKGDVLLKDYVDKEHDPRRLYEVECILDERKYGRGRQLMVKWKGFELDPDDWTAASNLKNTAALIAWNRQQHGVCRNN
ncbi:hypothetical protein WJX73_010214 [Symbiochloris irregularis]|uniref:Chromo domain-containing protein n=1 Tax=Symbiochloris irregularis TaxID=706552 RepID=A0AAW1P2T3_9CHLO